MSDPTIQLLEDAAQLDDSDVLASKRRAFVLPEDTIYLDGNSLGPLSVAAKQRASEVVEEQWGKGLITSWNSHSWIDLPFQTGEQIARLIGADKGQVVCCDSISVNLFKLLSAALAMNAPRIKVLTTIDNFPTDGYMVQGLNQMLGASRCELVCVDEDAIENAISDEIAIVLLTQVNFRTGVRLDIKSLTKKAHEVGALVIWDLAHSAGVIPLALDSWQVDFAVGCGYKFLNGGPGAPAFVYVARKHQDDYQQPLQGWMGHNQPFAFNPEYQPAVGVARNLAGTPGIISMSVMQAALTVFEDIDMTSVFEKSQELLETFKNACSALGVLSAFDCLTPTEKTNRGAQLALQHDNAYAICQDLISRGIIADFRRPNILRLGFSPLFLSYTDVVNAAIALANVMSSKSYLADEFQVEYKVT